MSVVAHEPLVYIPNLYVESCRALGNLYCHFVHLVSASDIFEINV